MKNKRRRSKKSSVKRPADFATALVRVLARARSYFSGKFALYGARKRVAARRRGPARAAARR